jgi:hypothetical protein
MHELVTLEQLNRLMLGVTLAGLPVGLIVGGLVRALGHRPRALAQGLFLGLTASAVGLLWLLFRWTVRLDPVNQYVGLYRPGVLAADVALFLALGVGLGWLWRKTVVSGEL